MFIDPSFGFRNICNHKKTLMVVDISYSVAYRCSGMSTKKKNCRETYEAVIHS